MDFQAGWSDQMTQDYFAHAYRDRGMTKWQGYYLSDHTSALNKAKHAAAIRYPARRQQTQAEIGSVLADAYANGKPVAVQLNAITPDRLLGPDIMGLVRGYTDTELIIGANTIDMQNIRNIKYVNQSK